MKVNDILSSKGTDVVTISGDRSISDLVALLRDHRIGAVVVSGGDGSVDGIVSERDVVRHLADGGASALDGRVDEIMTSDVHTCSPEDRVEDLANVMTERRIRHLPVVEDGRLVAIISIGDVVKHRIGQLQDERDHLERYVQQ